MKLVIPGIPIIVFPVNYLVADTEIYAVYADCKNTLSLISFESFYSKTRLKTSGSLLKTLHMHIENTKMKDSEKI